MTSPREHRIGPYTVLWRLGVTRAGTVYRAIDVYHTPVVLAVLDRATDGESRCRFSDAVRRGWSGDGGGSPVLAADLTGAVPWAATRADERSGAGHMLAAVTGEQPPSVSTVPPPVSTTRRPPAAGDLPPPPGVSGAFPPSGAPGVLPTRCGDPRPQPGVREAPGGFRSDGPAPPSRAGSRAGEPDRPSGHEPFDSEVLWPPLAAGDDAPPTVPATAVLTGQESPEEPPPPVRRTPRVLTGVLVCVGVFLVLAVPLVAIQLVHGGLAGQLVSSPGGGRPASTAPSAAASRVSEPARSPSPAPGEETVEPGLEPPDPGYWPDSWPHFTGGDKTHLMEDLAGVGFRFRLPAAWGCELTARDRATDHVRHTCVDERHFGGGMPPGIRLTVQDCPDPCDADAHQQLRGEVHGWGRRWLGPDEHSAYVEFKGTIDDDGYGLVISRVFSGTGADTPDRHLVLQAAVELDDIPTIRKIANEIRDATG